MRTLFLQSWIPEQAVQALCWTFIHSLWQGLVAALLAAAIIIGTRRSSALLRYNLLTALLFLFVAGAATTFALQWGAADAPVAGTESLAGQVAETATAPGSTTTSGTPAPESPWQQFQAYFNAQAPLIVLVWSLFFLYHFIRLLAGLNYIHRLRYTALQDPAEEWKDRLQQLGAQLGLRQHIQLFQSHLVKVPAVLGLLKPVILVPAGMLAQIPPASVEAVLLHELAHIRRKDFGVNLLQSVVELVFFFNPAFMWISSLIRQEREACCDDIVLEHTGDKKAYLEALVAFQEAAQPSSAYAVALAGRKTHLLNRVRRMLTQENKRLTIMEKAILLTALIGFSAFAFLPKDITAQPPVPVTAPEPPKAVAAAPTPGKLPTARVEAAPAAPAPKVVPAVAGEAPPAVAAAPLPDTIPGREKDQPYKSVTTNVNTENGKEVTETKVVTKDGSTYLVKKVDGKTTLMKVNGETVPQENWDDHQGLWKDVERRMEQDRKQRTVAARQRAEEAKQREAQTKVRMQEHKARQLELEQKRAEQKQHHREVVKHQEQARAEVRVAQRAEQEQRRTRQATTVAVPGNSTRDIEIITSELVSANIITDPADLSFTLTVDELTVNGQKVDGTVQQRLKERLKIGKEDSFQYKREGKSVTTTIVRN